METGNRKNSKSAPSAKKGSTAAPVKVIDWAGVEQAYCNTRQSTREIGKAFGISHTMVAKHAAAKGLVRPSKDQLSNPTPKKGKASKVDTQDSGYVAAPLEPREQRFVDEYLVDQNGSQAYMRAVPGTAEKTARTMASRLLARVDVQAALQTGRAALQERTQVTAARVVREIALIAFADPRELVETKVGCCRHCWGTNFLRQRTQFQRDVDFERWRLKAKDGEEFDEEGGTGYNPHRAPHPDCIECCGDGVSREVVKDTRYLSPSAAALYAGVRRTKDGIQVLTQDKGAALERLARHLGIFEKDNGQRNDPLALRTLTDAERVVRLNKLLSGDPTLACALAVFLSPGDGA